MIDRLIDQLINYLSICLIFCMLLFAEIWSSSFHQWKYERKIAIRLRSFLCRAKAKQVNTSFYNFSFWRLWRFSSMLILDEPKNSKHSVYTTATRRWSWFWLRSGAKMQTVHPGVVSQLHSVKNPSPWACNTPYSCHGVFTDRSIISLNLAQIQIPAGT